MKRLFTFLLTFWLLISAFFIPLQVSAEVVYKGKIEIPTINANVGDTVVMPIDFKENPGIIAVSIDFTYNSSALQYIGFSKGDVLKTPSLKVQTGADKIRLVTLENSERTNSGTLLSLKFKVKSTAEMGLAPISIKYSSGDFCNWNEDRIMPEIVSGGVNIAFNGKNCSHKSYGEWQTVAVPSCQNKGIKQRSCKNCGHLEQADIEKTDHKFSENFTVLNPATENQKGVAVRYCLFCDAYTDEKEFSFQQSEDGKFENLENATIPEEEGKDFPEKEDEGIVDKYDDMIENIAPEYNTYGNMTVLEKIAEYLPSLETILYVLESILMAFLKIIFI